MTCQDLDGLSFNELLLLETHLNAVLLIVRDQKKKIKEEEDQKNEDDGLGTTRQVFSGSSSSGERQEQQHGDAPLPVMSRDQIEFERQSAASMEIKFEKLWLLKERMNGRELEGMNSAELQVLEDRIIQALEDPSSQELEEHRQVLMMSNPSLVKEKLGKHSKELFSKLDNMKQQLEKVLGSVATTCSLEDSLPDSPFASPKHHFLEFGAAADTNGSAYASLHIL